MDELLKYFNGDDSASTVWSSKYCIKNKDKIAQESIPDDMHRRMAKEFYKEDSLSQCEKVINREDFNNLSLYGRTRRDLTEESIYQLFKGFKKIVPQGSIMDMLGNPYKIGSLSNCVVIGAPFDSYGGIMQKDEQLAQLMKRRCGVGIDISTLRPDNVSVSNAAGTSTGAVSFMHRYSGTTREVGQEGRRGALMLTIDCRHPDLEQFIDVKKDLNKVTGANISVKWRDDFIIAVQKDEDYILRWPIDTDLIIALPELSYNTLESIPTNNGEVIYVKRIKAREVFNKFVENNWLSAEPGAMFLDRHWDYSPDSVYEAYKGITSNPCGEVFMGEYDACRLLALNLMSIVDKPYTSEAKIDLNRLYELSYEQQILADDLVGLELKHILAILRKIESGLEPLEIKRVEMELWGNLYRVALGGRRTGCGHTGLGDMLAALGSNYCDETAQDLIHAVFSTKMRGELDATIDMSILRGSFEGWDRELEKVD